MKNYSLEVINLKYLCANLAVSLQAISIKIIQTKDIDENIKHTLTKKYNWFPEPGTKDDWYEYFTYEIL